MKLADVLKITAAMLATDSSPAGIAAAEAAVIAADKKAKDGMGPAEIEKGDKDKPAKDSDKDEDGKDKPAKDSDKDEDEDDKPVKDAEVDVNAKDDGLSAADPAPPGGKREKGKVAVDKAAMDAAIATAVAGERALNAAREAVKPILGVVAFDSAEQVYRAALTKLAVDHKDVPAAALPAFLKVATDAATAKAGPAPIATDAATVKGMAALIPGYARIK